MEAWKAMFSHRFVLYGGARGGGKSRFLRWAGVSLLLWHATEGRTGVVGGLFCSTYPELRDRQISKISAEFPAWLGELKDSQQYGLAFHLKPEYGGGVMVLRNLDDPSKYKSSEFAFILWDELTQTADKDVFNVLRGSLRWADVEHTVFVGATNPDGPGNLWVREMWVERQFPPELRPLEQQFVFVRALPEDNPHLSQQYWEDLKTLPPDLRKAWVEGDWYVFAGQAFGQFRLDRHVINPVELPAHYPRWRGVDWGYSAPWCCMWLARDPDNGRIYVYREAYQTDLTDKQQARVIQDMTPPEERITLTYADPSMWASKNLQGIVSSTADEYSQSGVPLTRADNDRLSGKRKLDRMLENMTDGKPGIQIFSTCPNIIRQLSSLAYDKIHVEDVDTKQEDHAYDALRYGLTQARDYTQTRRLKATDSPWAKL